MRSLVKRRKWWLVSAPLLAACWGCHPHGEEGEHATEEHAAEASVTVRAVPARFDRSARVVEGLGRCEALPDHIAPLTPAVEGHVHELLVEPGRPGEEGPADRRARQGRGAGRPEREDGDPRRAGRRARPAQVDPPPRGAQGQRAGRRAGQASRVEQARVAADRLRPLVASHEVSEQQILDAEQGGRSSPRSSCRRPRPPLHVMMIGPRPEAIAEAEGRIKTADALGRLLAGPPGITTPSARRSMACSIA